MDYNYLESPGKHTPLGEAFSAIEQIIEKQDNIKKQHINQNYQPSDTESKLIKYLKDNIHEVQKAVKKQQQHPNTILVIQLEKKVQWFAPLVPNIKELELHQPLYFQYLTNTLTSLLNFVKDLEQQKVMPGSVRDYYRKQFGAYAQELLREHDVNISDDE